MESSSAHAHKKGKANITARAYLTIEAKQDIEEIYGYIDAERKGYFTEQELHAALNEAAGKTISKKAVRALAARMDASGHGGEQVLHHDFLEYMAQKMQLSEPYDELMRSEQAQLMREVGSKVCEVLELFKRRRMLHDAMEGGDGIKRLLKLTHVPVSRPKQRKGPVPPGGQPAGQQRSSSSAAGGVGALASRTSTARSLQSQASASRRQRLGSAGSASMREAGSLCAQSSAAESARPSSGGSVRVSTNGAAAAGVGGGGVRGAVDSGSEGAAAGSSPRGARRTSSSPSRLAAASFGRLGSLRDGAGSRPGSGRQSGSGEKRLQDSGDLATAAATEEEAKRAARVALIAAAAAIIARPPDRLIPAQVGGERHTFAVRRLGTAADLSQARPHSAWPLASGRADGSAALLGSGATSVPASANNATGPAPLMALASASRGLAHASSAPSTMQRAASALAGSTSRSLGAASGATSGCASAGAASVGGSGHSSWRSPELLEQVLDCMSRSGLSDPELHGLAQALGLAPGPGVAASGMDQEPEDANARVVYVPAYAAAPAAVARGQDTAVAQGEGGAGWAEGRSAAAGTPVGSAGLVTFVQRVRAAGNCGVGGGDDDAANGGGQLRDGMQPQLQPMPNVLLGTPSAHTVVLDISGPPESDPLLAKLPDWVRKRLGLPPAPVPPPPAPSPPPTQAHPPQGPRRAVSVSSTVATGGTRSAGSPERATPSSPPSPFASASSRTFLSEVQSAWGGGERGTTGDGASVSAQSSAPADLSSVPTTPSRRGGAGAGRPLSGRSAGSLSRYVPFGGDTAAVVEEGAEEDVEAMAAAKAATPRTPPPAMTWLPATPSPLRRSSMGANEAHAVPADVRIERPRSASPGPCPSPSALAPHRDFSLRRPASASASLSGRETPAIWAPQAAVTAQPLPTRGSKEAEAPAVTGAAAAEDGSCFGSPSRRRSTAAWLAAAADAAPEPAPEVEVYSPDVVSSSAAAAGGGGRSGGEPVRDDWGLARLSSTGYSLLLEGEEGDGDEEVEVLDSGGMIEDPALSEAGQQQGQALQKASTVASRPSALSSLLEPHSSAAAAALAEAEASRAPAVPDPCAELPASAARAKRALVFAPPFDPTGRRPGIVAALASPAELDARAGDLPVRDKQQHGLQQLSCRTSSRTCSRPQSRTQARSPSPRARSAVKACASAAGAVQTFPGPPFLVWPQPLSPEVPPSAFQVVAAAEAALAEAEAHGRGGGGLHSDGSDGRGAPTLWSAEYAPVKAASAGTSASGPRKVRLNRASLLRLSSQYGADAVDAAGLALGLRGSSEAAREVATREVLRSLSCRTSGNSSVGSGALGRQATGGALGAGPERPAHSGQLGLEAVSKGGRKPHHRPASVESWAHHSQQQLQQQQRHLQAAKQPHMLPSDALAFGRQMRTLAARLSSEGAAASRPASAGQHRSTSASRPSSAGPGPPSGGTSRPASASRPRSAAVQHRTQRPASAVIHGSGDAATRPLSASAAGGGVLQPNRTRPTIMSRVQQLDGEEVARCLSAAAAPASIGPPVCTASESISRRSPLVPLLRLEQARTSSSGAPSESCSPLGTARWSVGEDPGSQLGAGEGEDGGDGVVGGSGGGGGGGRRGGRMAVRVVAFGSPHGQPVGAGAVQEGAAGAATALGEGGAEERRRLEVTGKTALPSASQEDARERGGLMPAPPVISWRQALKYMAAS